LSNVFGEGGKWKTYSVAWDAGEELGAGGVAAGVGLLDLAAHFSLVSLFTLNFYFRGSDSEGSLSSCERCFGVEGEGERGYLYSMGKVRSKSECSRIDGECGVEII
jgi:hypothetical protein